MVVSDDVLVETICMVEFGLSKNGLEWFNFFMMFVI